MMIKIKRGILNFTNTNFRIAGSNSGLFVNSVFKSFGAGASAEVNNDSHPKKFNRVSYNAKLSGPEREK